MLSIPSSTIFCAPTILPDYMPTAWTATSIRTHLKNASQCPGRRCGPASKCSHTIVYAPLLNRPAPCPEPWSTFLRWVLFSYLENSFLTCLQWRLLKKWSRIGMFFFNPRFKSLIFIYSISVRNAGYDALIRKHFVCGLFFMPFRYMGAYNGKR